MNRHGPWNDDRPAAKGLPVRENFAAWFGSSRVRTAVGRPAVTYHATWNDFDCFDWGRLGMFVSNPTTRLGFYFSENPTQVDRWLDSSYARACGDAPRILPVYLRNERPLEIDSSRFVHLVRRARAATIDKLVAKAVEHGNDGFRIGYRRTDAEGKETGENATWWVPLHPGQIKSAIGNSGLFLRESRSFVDQPPVMNRPSHAQQPLGVSGVAPDADVDEAPISTAPRHRSA